MDELKPHMQIGLLIKSKPFIQLHTFGWIVFAEPLIYGNYDKDFYFVDADYVTVELVELIEDVKKIIPLETYFESVAEWDYLSHSHSKENAA